MKKLFSLCLIFVMLLSLTACSQKPIEPQSAQMKSICELATMKCYFHNVAKYTEKDATKFLFWAKDRKFWIEYAGVVTIGIDASKLKLEVQGDNVKITIPSAKVLNCIVDSATLNDDSFIIAKDSAEVKAEHQKAAFTDAQAKMLEAARSNNALLSAAQQRAQKLIEDYIKNIGDSLGKEYIINWEYIEDTDDSEQTDLNE